MEINYFDLIIAAIILLLGLKGIINGFFKELFGLIGIIGGIFIASRLGDQVGEYLSDIIFHFTNHSAISFTGFLVTLIVFWIAMVIVGMLFKKLSSLSGLGIFDRILGFVFGASKFFLIAAVIAFAVSNVKALKPTLDSAFSNSVLFPVLVKTGGFIMKIDPSEISKSVNDSVADASHEVSEHIKEAVDENVKENIEEIKEELKKEH
jgi:membrane protein required for colicin V production